MPVNSLQARPGGGGACRVKGINDICTHAFTVSHSKEQVPCRVKEVDIWGLGQEGFIQLQLVFN